MKLNGIRMLNQPIILQMDSKKHSLKFQLRLQTCVLKEVAVPAQYSFTIQSETSQDQQEAIPSACTPWKEARENDIRFVCFLRLRLTAFQESFKCLLQLYSRSGCHSSLIGSVNITVSQNRCNRIRKYTLRSGADAKGTIQASIFLKNCEDSISSIERPSSGIVLQSNYSTISRQQASLDVDSIIDHLKSQERETDLEIQEKSDEKRHRTLKIGKEVQVAVGERDFDARDAQSLLLKLFQEIGKKDLEIGKKQAEINERDAQIKHIKMKELIFKKDEIKLKRLKKQTEFLLAANDILGSKDTKYEEQYQNMRRQKGQMGSIMEQITTQSAAKISHLKNQLESARKQLQNREKKVSSLQQQLSVYTSQISELRESNKEKHRIVNSIKIELNKEQMIQLGSKQPVCLHDHQSYNSRQVKKSKSLSLFNQKLEESKQQNNLKTDKLFAEQVPGIVSFLLGLHSKK